MIALFSIFALPTPTSFPSKILKKTSIKSDKVHPISIPILFLYLNQNIFGISKGIVASEITSIFYEKLYREIPFFLTSFGGKLFVFINLIPLFDDFFLGANI